MIAEEHSELAFTVWNRAATTTSSLLVYAEGRAALAAAARHGRIAAPRKESARALLDHLVDEMILIEPGDSLVRVAGSLAEQHQLRGSDAVHLASAISAGPGTTMVSWDVRVARAAQASGLEVVGP